MIKSNVTPILPLRNIAQNASAAKCESMVQEATVFATTMLLYRVTILICSSRLRLPLGSRLLVLPRLTISIWW